MDINSFLECCIPVLTFIVHVLIVILAVGTLAMILLLIDLAVWFYKGWVRERDSHISRQQAKDKLRQQKEDEAWADYFTVTFTPGFDPNGSVIMRASRLPSAEAMEYWKEMNRRVDDDLFKNIEEF